MKYCCFWEGIRPPEYLAWCVSSWRNFINLDDVLFLNHSNVSKYLGDLVSVDSLRHFSFAKQSDIVSAAFLYKFGGMFLDVDTIFVNDRCEQFTNIDLTDDKFVFFGNAAISGIHVGVLASSIGGTIVSNWQDVLFERTLNWRKDDNWAYVANQILYPLIVKSSALEEKWTRIDTAASLFTPEVQFSENHDAGNREKYEHFWFKQNVEPSLLTRIVDESHGILALHNSWTPRHYAQLVGSNLVESPTTLSALLRRVGNIELIPEIQERIHLGI